MSLPNMSCTSYSQRNGRKLSSNTLEELELKNPQFWNIYIFIIGLDIDR